MPKTTTYEQGQVPVCPHCGKSLEGSVEDYVIPGAYGVSSRRRGDCGWCDGEFVVMREADTAYTVTAIA